MKRLLFIIACLLPFLSFSQNEGPRRVSLGVRSTVSLFNHGSDDDAGYGAGGQIRIRLTDRINTEWFADFLTSRSSNLGFRNDAHIGWSVMYYLKDTEQFTRKFTPYLIAGHCFDYTKVEAFVDPDIQFVQAQQTEASRWSSAVQAGLGSHYNLTPRLDVSLSAQYMMHFGNHIHIEGDLPVPYVVEEDHSGVEGHLLVSLSMNIKL
ncbi:MAG: outer membrane beta-barrel protein [Bacteroidia bacterium]